MPRKFGADTQFNSGVFTMQPALTSLLKRFKAKVALLLALLIFATTIVLPGSAPLYAQGSGNPTVTAQAGNQQVATVVYVVKRGDTLGAIARTYNTTITSLMRLNPQIR